eukprot:scpid20856/ scgid30220/ DNA polymerase subunit gamma-1; Mitochondrial DNA polymerase catalytic subunit; PolG-alpha
MHSRLVPLRPLRCQANRRHASTKLKTYRLAPASSSTEHASVSGQQGASGNAEKQASPESGGKNTRHNLFGIQMLPDELRKPIFGERSSGTTSPDPVAALHARKELIEKYNLLLKSETQECPEFEMPQLLGSDVAEHFREIGRRQCQPYLQYADALMGVESLPGMPTKWQFTPGWCRYSAQCPQGKPVPFPDEKVLVFDVEVWMEAPTLPILAVAASPTAWYSWTSEVLTEKFNVPKFLGSNMKRLIPIAGPEDASLDHEWSERLVIGHNVSFDRSYIREEYLLDGPKTRFLDTLSLHVISGGLTNSQKMMMKKFKKLQRLHRTSSTEDLVSVLLDEQRKQPRGFVDKDGEAFGGMFPDSEFTQGEESLKWLDVGCMNGLKDLYRFHCKKEMDKSTVEMFVSAESLSEIRDRFQEGMRYCANDVQATFDVFRVVYKHMQNHAPHPCSIAGMLHMGSCYLPVDTSWPRYVDRSERTYHELLGVMKSNLMVAADSACQIADRTDELSADPWLNSLAWTRHPSPAMPRAYVQEMMRWLAQGKDDAAANPSNSSTATAAVTADARSASSSSPSDSLPALRTRTEHIASVAAARKRPQVPEVADSDATARARGSPSPAPAFPPPSPRRPFVSPVVEEFRLRCRIPHMANYPEWYRQACPPIIRGGRHEPTYLTASRRASPLLLRLTWDGSPLHHMRDLGWGYLVPMASCDYQARGETSVDATLAEAMVQPNADLSGQPMPVYAAEFLQKAAVDFHNAVHSARISAPNVADSEQETSSSFDYAKHGAPQVVVHEHPDTVIFHPVYGPLNFFRLPHKDGRDKNVGSPLAKSFFSKMEDGTLKSADSDSSGSGAELLRLNSMIAYWRSARARIQKQIVYWLDRDHLPDNIKSDAKFSHLESYGAILPRLIACGTITRRGVEPCWMTVSNAEPNRVGSELKAMVRTPPGYCFVGADVDSEELWISGILADSHLAREHGCTPIGWMNLQGNKADGTDMHSRTAATIGISRNAAKTFNYARIYGAGKKHATSLLLQFNHRLSVAEAESRAEILYNATKGKKRVKLSNRGQKLAQSAALPVEQDGYLSVKHASALIHYSSEGHEGKHSDEEDDGSDDDDDNSHFQNPQLFAGASYSGGSESHLFNRLDDMIKMRRPATPALGVTAPKPILRDNIQKQFVPSRINWIVQSSGVDFLHALLVNMRWLMDEFKIDGRLSISIHDEVRFLVAKEDRYRAALALHISNLLVRSLFSYQLNMNDLPQSVAFFSQVDIDSCMRKEVDLDCVTPSNPFGLRRGHAVDYGEGVDMAATVKKTGGSLRKPSAT